MPYYAGDGRGNYGAGGYAYQAGGIFGSIGKFLGKVARSALSIGTGGASEAVIGAVSRPAVQRPPTSLPEPPPVPKGYPGAQPRPGIGGAIERFLPGGKSGYVMGPYSCVPNGAKRGRLNKSTYVTRGGGTSRWPEELVVHEKGTECVGIRRMNPANPQALRRSIRRTRGAMKLLRGAASACGYTVVSRAALAKRPKARRR